MEELYIKVHPQDVVRTYHRYLNGEEVLIELKRIKPSIAIISDPPMLPDDLPEAGAYRVCGAYYTGFFDGCSAEKQCVDDILEQLADKGKNAEVYLPATLVSTMSNLAI